MIQPKSPDGPLESVNERSSLAEGRSPPASVVHIHLQRGFFSEVHCDRTLVDSSRATFIGSRGSGSSESGTFHPAV